jgi:hypothetical protein
MFLKHLSAKDPDSSRSQTCAVRRTTGRTVCKQNFSPTFLRNIIHKQIVKPTKLKCEK